MDIPDFGSRIEIEEIGGDVHYSFEMRAHLASLPIEEANRICAEIEWRNRRRKVYSVKPISLELINHN